MRLLEQRELALRIWSARRGANIDYRDTLHAIYLSNLRQKLP